MDFLLQRCAVANGGGRRFSDCRRFGLIFFFGCARIFATVALSLSAVCLASAALPDGAPAAIDASSAHRADSTKTRVYRLDTVTVTATPPFDWQHSIASIQTIPLTEFNTIAPLTSALTEAEGFYIRNYGGGTALATATTRGMYAEETTLLIDGVRINSLQNGVVDLSKIPLLGLSTAQISRGGGTVGFDETAGGTIELTTAQPPSSFIPSVTLQDGSYGEHAGSFALPVKTGNVTTSIDASYNTATNNFTYILNGASYQRIGSDYENSYITTHTVWAPSPTNDGESHDLILSYLNSNEGVASAVTSAVQPTGGREDDQIFFALLHSRWMLADSLPFETSFHAAYARESFLDSTLYSDGEPLLSDYLNRQIDFTARLSWLPGDCWTLRYGIHGLFASISSGDVLATMRGQGQSYANGDYTINTGGGLLQLITMRAIGRVDSYSDHTTGVSGNGATLVTGSFGGVATLFDDRSAAIRANIGTAGRMPTLNELYWIPGGNPNLQPDHSVKGEFGGHYEKNILGNIALDADGFIINTKDLIIWEPGANGIWSPINIDAVRSSGFEWSAKWQPTEFISTSFAQQFASAIKLDASFPGDASQGKQLPFVPRETFHANLTVSLFHNMLTFRGNADYASFRYITSDNTQYIPGYTLFSIAVSTRLSAGVVNITPSLMCDNLTNTEYQVFPGYPMPERMFLLSLTFQIKDTNNE